MPDDSIVELDVRPLFERGRPPLAVILDAVNRLTPEQSLRLVAPFEPKPLYDLLGQRGYTAQPQLRPDGAWEILFQPTAT